MPHDPSSRVQDNNVKKRKRKEKCKKSDDSLSYLISVIKSSTQHGNYVRLLLDNQESS